MGEIVVQIIFGWPAMITSTLLSIAGVWLRKPILVLTAGIVCIPFTHYLSVFRMPAVVLPLFQFGAAYAIRRQTNLLAWLLIVPIIVIEFILAYAVLTIA